MPFEEAVRQTPGLAGAYRPGLQALENAHRGKVHCSDTHDLLGSVFVDDALVQRFPDGHRWDYGIGVKKDNLERVVWLEVHSATTHGVSEVLAKLDWLKDWLNNDGVRLRALSSGAYHWVASGRIDIPKNTPQYRRAAQRGMLPERGLNL
jgi:hypothetical protein